MAASPDLDLARAHLLVARADQAKKKSKSAHKGTKVMADKENEDVQSQEGSCPKKKKAVSIAYVALLYECHLSI